MSNIIDINDRIVAKLRLEAYRKFLADRNIKLPDSEEAGDDDAA